MLSMYPPLEAYRRDVARLGEAHAFGEHDGRWVSAAVLLHRYAEADPNERVAIGSELARHLAFDSDLTVCRAGLRFGAEIEDAGALHLASAWLALLERIVPADRELDIGRLRAQRARVARKLGAIDAARDWYSEVERIGEARGEPELTARSWIGFAVLAQMRGNYPEARRWYRAAAVVADDAGCVEQSFQAHQGLLVAAAVAGDFDRAMVEGWRAFLASEHDPDREAEILANMAQVLHDVGKHDAALHGFGAAVARSTSPRILLGALGGVAVAAGALGRRHAVTATAQRIEGLASAAWLHAQAYAFLEVAQAYAALNEPIVSERYRARALALAEKNGFNELIHRAEAAAAARPAPRKQSEAVELSAAAAQVVNEIESLDAPADLCAVC